MNKKSLFIFASIVTIIMMVSMTSCDSLWKVQESSNISMNINFLEIMGIDEGEVRSVSSNTPSLIDSDSDIFDDEDRITVSLYYANTDRNLATKEFFFDDIDDITDVEVSFDNVDVGINIYARIIVDRFDDGAWGRFFESRSASVKTEKKITKIVTYANVIFLAHENGADQNTSASAGLTADNPVKSFNDALALLKQSGSFLPGATIYVTQSIEVDNADSELGQRFNGGRLLDLGGVTIKRQQADYPFFEIEDGNSLTLTRSILQGDERATAPLITVTGTGSAVTLTGGTVLQDNINTYNSSNIEESTAGVNVLDGAKLIMEDSAIINNKVLNSNAAAGVNLGDGSILELQGGDVLIRDNVTDTLLDSNVHYNLPTSSVIDIDTFPVQVTGELSENSEIGLSPNIGWAITFEIVASNGGEVHQGNFSMDDGSSVIPTDDGHLTFIPPKNIYIGGATSSDDNDGLTENTPVKTFAKAKELFNNRDIITIVGTIIVEDDEVWAPNEGQVIELGYTLSDADFTFVHINEGKTLQFENLSIVSSRISYPIFTVEGTLELAGNVFIGSDPSPESIILQNNGKLKIHSGNIRIDRPVTYTVTSSGESPVSLEGNLYDDPYGPLSVIYLNPNPPQGESLTDGTVIVEKGLNATIDPDSFVLDVNSAKSFNAEGDLVFMIPSDEIYIDGQNGDDARRGDSVANAVKTFDRARLLTSSTATIFVVDTIPVNDAATWNIEGKNITLKRHASCTNPLIEVNNNGILNFTNYINLTIDGNELVSSTSPLILVNGGEVNFVDGNKVSLKNNNNTEGAGAILINGGHVTIEKSGIYESSVIQPTVINNTSKEGFGAITVQNDGLLTLDDAYISQNFGGGAHVASNGTLVLAGTTSVRGNMKSAAGGDKNITYDMSADESYGIFIGNELTSTEDAVIGITLNVGQEEGTPIVRKLANSTYTPTSEDFQKFFSDDPSIPFYFDSVLGQVEKPTPYFYVSETGDDNNNGTEDKPFASVQRAVDKALLNVGLNGYMEFVITISGRVTQDSDDQDNAMITIDRGDLASNVYITLKGDALNPGILDASGKNQRVLYIGAEAEVTFAGNLTITGGIADEGAGVYVEDTASLTIGSEYSYSSAVIVINDNKNNASALSNVYYKGGYRDQFYIGHLTTGSDIGITEGLRPMFISPGSLSVSDLRKIADLLFNDNNNNRYSVDSNGLNFTVD